MSSAENGFELSGIYHPWDEVRVTELHNYYVYRRPDPELMKGYLSHVATCVSQVADNLGIQLWQYSSAFSKVLRNADTYSNITIDVGDIRTDGRRRVTITCSSGLEIETIISEGELNPSSLYFIDIFLPIGYVQIYPRFVYFNSRSENFVTNYDVSIRYIEGKLVELNKEIAHILSTSNRRLAIMRSMEELFRRLTYLFVRRQ